MIDKPSLYRSLYRQIMIYKSSFIDRLSQVRLVRICHTADMRPPLGTLKFYIGNISRACSGKDFRSCSCVNRHAKGTPVLRDNQGENSEIGRASCRERVCQYV